MSHRPMAVCLPCHGWEDFPTHYRGAEAQQILTAWTALWHPQLLALAGDVPTWRHPSSSYAPPPSLALLPQVSDVPDQLSDSSIPTYRLPHQADRLIVIQEVLRQLQIPALTLPADLVTAFFAWGYATMQVQFLTRQMRYSCSLDTERFGETVRLAAEGAVRGDWDVARAQIQSGFDQLAQERDHYYPVEVFLLELLLTTPEMLQTSLLDQLVAGGSAKNLLAGAAALSHWTDRDGCAESQLRGMLADKQLCLVGGEPTEQRLPLWPADAVVHHLQQGEATYRRCLGTAPTVFGRRQFGLSPTLPEWLKRLGYRGALHFTLDDGKFPRPYQAKATWQGISGATLEMVGRLPADASLPETFLYLATQLSQSMDGDHAATAVLAYWPGHQAEWLHDLRYAATIFPVLGKFVTLDDYLAHPSYMAHADRQEADAYRSPYLLQDVAAGLFDPITGQRLVWENWRSEQAAQNLASLTRLARSAAASGTTSEGTHEMVVIPTAPDDTDQSRMQDFAVAMAGPPRADAAAGWLVANPWGVTRRTLVHVPHFEGETLQGEGVIASGRQQGEFYGVIDVPPCGFAWIPQRAESTERTTTPAARRHPHTAIPQVAEGHVLQNEFLRITIDPATGGIGSLRDYRHRDNLLSQQLAYREPADAARGLPVRYTRMVADSVRMVATGTVWGSIESTGRMVSAAGDELYRFRQRYLLWRGSRTVWVDVQLEPLTDQLHETSSPWDEYVAVRLAWRDVAPHISRNLHFARQPTSLTRFEAPGYVDIECGHGKITLLCPGLPYHRLIDQRMLDTLLLTGREAARTFRCGIGLDVTCPWQEWIAGPEGLTPSELDRPGAITWSTPCAEPWGGGRRGWLIQLNCRNVWLSDLRPIGSPSGMVHGFRARLTETEGRAAHVQMECFRPLSSGRILDLLGHCESTARVENGALLTTLGSFECVEVEAHWT